MSPNYAAARAYEAARAAAYAAIAASKHADYAAVVRAAARAASKHADYAAVVRAAARAASKHADFAADPSDDAAFYKATAAARAATVALQTMKQRAAKGNG